MTAFDDRRNAHEGRFAHDAETEFKARARASRELGLWAAGLMGRNGAAAEDYAKELVAASLSARGDSAIHERVSRDLGGVADATAARSRLDELRSAARRDLRGG